MLLLLALITTYVSATETIDLTAMGAATRHDFEVMAAACHMVPMDPKGLMCGMLKQKNSLLEGAICPQLFSKPIGNCESDNCACDSTPAQEFVASCYYSQEGCAGMGMEVSMPFNNQCAKHPYMNKVINLMQNFVCDCTGDCGVGGCDDAYANCIAATAGTSMDGCQVGKDHNLDFVPGQDNLMSMDRLKLGLTTGCVDVDGGSYHKDSCSDRRRLSSDYSDRRRL